MDALQSYILGCTGVTEGKRRPFLKARVYFFFVRRSAASFALATDFTSISISAEVSEIPLKKFYRFVLDGDRRQLIERYQAAQLATLVESTSRFEAFTVSAYPFGAGATN